MSRYVPLVTAALAVVACVGCHSRSNRGVGETTDAFVVLVESEVGTLDPRFAATSYEIKVSRLVFSGLMMADTEDLSVQPLLAESVTAIDEDGLVFEAVLREGLTFHDGKPLTSRDVVYTFESVLDPALASRYRATYSYIEKIEAVDRKTVRFTLSETNASFLPDLTLPILPAHVLKTTGGRFEADDLVGSGPYRLEGRSPGRIELRRVATDGPGRVVFLTVRDDNARVLRIQGGGADLAQNNIPLHLLTLFQKRESTRVISAPGSSFTYLGLNLESEPLDDPRVREALLLAIDRDAIIEHKLKGLAKPSTGMLPPSHWAYHDDGQNRDYDPKRAKELLDEAGLTDPDGDGPKTRFSLVFKTSSSRFRVAIARVIASYLTDVGIEVDLRPFEFSTLRSHLDSGAYQITCLQIPMVIEPNLYRWFFHSQYIPDGKSRGGANRWRYRSAEADSLIDRGIKVLDTQSRKAVYSDLQSLLAEDLPVLPLWHEDSVAVISNRTTNYELLPTAPFTPLAKTKLEP